MKKLLSLFLATVMMLSLVACGKTMTRLPAMISRTSPR